LGTVAYKTTTLVVKNCCCNPCPPPCPCSVLDRLEPERACVSVYKEFGITALFKGWPCLDPCEPCNIGTQGMEAQNITTASCPCPPQPDCGCGCNGKKVVWTFAFKCCGGVSPVLGDDYEIVEISGEFGQIIKVRFFRTCEWTVTATINGESVTGRYGVVVQ